MKTNGLDTLYSAVLLGMRLQMEIDEFLATNGTTQKPPRTAATPATRRHWTQTPEGRKRMTAIQKARWKTTKQIERGVLPKAAR